VIRFTLNRVIEIRKQNQELDSPGLVNTQKSLVSCVVCGLNLPKEDALIETLNGDEFAFCCPEHQQDFHKSVIKVD
jgi:YHS domain-containing protein